MYTPIPLDLSSSLFEFVGEARLFERPDSYEVDVQEYILKYPHLKSTDVEQLCFAIIDNIKKKYNRPCTLINVPMKSYKVMDIISSSMVGHMVNVDCVIRKIGEVKLEMILAVVKCKKCGYEFEPYEPNPMDVLRLPPGVECENYCGGKTVILVPEKCEYVDSQYITAQELQENTIHAKQPKSIICVMRRSLVDKVNAGEKVRLTGIVKIKYEKNLFSSVYLEVFGISQRKEEECEVVLSDEDISNIKQLSCNPKIYDILSSSISPLVYGYNDIKRAIIFQIFGGTTIDLKDGAHIRGNSHILLCGDPGLAKSKLLTAVSTLVPNSVYTSGKSSSAAGLTAAAVRDEVDGKWVLEAGALPLADGGMAVVDELDKMSNEDRSALHEAMEQQTITVNKAGISTQLLTRCSLLAAANPSLGKFDRAIPLSDQLDLPPSLLSRFDLIYLMTDDVNKDTDMRVAKHILESRRNAEVVANGNIPDSFTGIEKPIDTQMFRKYLVYAKSIVPIIEDQIIDVLAKEYVRLRSEENDGYKSVHIRVTPRQLEALIRLSEASARIRLSKIVSKEDIDRALSLYTSAMSNITLSSEQGDSVWNRGDSIVLSLVSHDGIELTELVKSIQQYSLMDEEQINNELLNLTNHNRVQIVRIGNQTFVKKSI